jgi:hypothetical protein
VDGAAKPSSSGSGGDTIAAATMEGRFADLCKVQALACCGFRDAGLGRSRTYGRVLKFDPFPVQVRILLPPWCVLASQGRFIDEQTVDDLQFLQSDLIWFGSAAFPVLYLGGKE